MHILQPFLPTKAIQTGIAILLIVCTHFLFLRAYPSHIQIYQAAKGVKTSYNALIDLFESIEHLLKHLDIYTQIPSTPAMDEMVVKIMVEVLTTLALTTKDLTQGRPSESILANILHKLKGAQRNL
jgi:hypothetical protein